MSKSPLSDFLNYMPSSPSTEIVFLALPMACRLTLNTPLTLQVTLNSTSLPTTESWNQNLEVVACRILQFYKVHNCKALEKTGLELNLETASLASKGTRTGQQCGEATPLLHILI